MLYIPDRQQCQLCGDQELTEHTSAKFPDKPRSSDCKVRLANVVHLWLAFMLPIIRFLVLRDDHLC